MTIKEYIVSNNINRLALVGTNSQGKTYMLEQLARDSEIKTCSICVWTEVKADENLKNTADSTTLVLWLNRLVDMSELKSKIDEKISDFDFTSINDNNFINVSLSNNLSSCKGLIGAEIATSSNTYHKPGAGERFLGQLYLISKILEGNNDDFYKYLIVDEPERHLHPSLYIKMSMILNKISKQGIKVIISTHSSEILNYFVENTNEIVKMKDGNPIFVQSKEDLIDLRDDFNVYTDENFKFSSFKKIENNIDLYFEKFILPIIYRSLFSEVVFVVEGYAEEEVMKLYKEKYKDNYKMGSLEYSVVFGKCFFPWIVSILKTLQLRVISIYDKDSDDSKHKNLNVIIQEVSDDYIEVDPKVEKELELPTGTDKVKLMIIELRKMYMDNNEKLEKLLIKINEKLNG
jgi:predicted ATPase